MFLPWISTLGMLSDSSDTNILARFPLNVRKTVVAEISRCLVPNNSLFPDACDQLTSPAHVWFAMEIVGQGLALPLEDIAVIQNCITIYSAWLLEPRARPLAVREMKGSATEQLFWQKIFHHVSLLFQPRGLYQLDLNASSVSGLGSKNSLYGDAGTQQVEICRKALKLLTMAGRTLGSEFSQETWITLLKITLGASDFLLREPSYRDAHSPRGAISPGVAASMEAAMMADGLCENMIRVLFELWLRSKLTNSDMWARLKGYFRNWTHRVEVVHQWNATALALSQRVIRFLYGPSEGSDSVNIAVDGYNVTIDLPIEFVYNAWHRILMLIGNPNELSPAKYTVAIRGISKLVESFLSIGKSNASNPSNAIPDGNTLMHLFGAWLLEATTFTEKDYEKGKADAYATLIKICSQHQRRNKLNQTYVDRFYLAIIEGLRSDASSLTAIITHGGELLAVDLEGSRVLAPYFVAAIRKILPQITFETPAHHDDLRLAALKILAQISVYTNYAELIPAPEHFGVWAELAAAAGTSAGGDQMIWALRIQTIFAKTLIPTSPPTFAQLKPLIVETFIATVSTDRNTRNIKYMVNFLCQWIFEDVRFCPESIPKTIVQCILDRMLRPDTWKSDVINCALVALSNLVGIGDFCKSREFLGSVQKDIIMSLCRMINQLLADEREIVTSQGTILRAFECITRWFVAHDGVYANRDVMVAVISVMCRGVCVLDRDDEFAQISAAITGALTKEPSVASQIDSHYAPLPAAQRDSNAAASGTANAFSILSQKMRKDKFNPIKALRHSRSTSQNTSAALKNMQIVVQTNAEAYSAGGGVNGAGLPSGGDAARTTSIPRSATGGISTSSKDGGWGLPTFALLSAETNIKLVAENCLTQMVHYMGGFPPYLSGVSRVSTLWRETDEVARLVQRERSRVAVNAAGTGPTKSATVSASMDFDEAYYFSQIGGSNASSNSNTDDALNIKLWRKYIRYYAIDGKTIIAVVERPVPSYSGENGNVPGVTAVLRDCHGKHSWLSALKYSVEPVPPPCKRETQPSFSSVPPAMPYKNKNEVVRAVCPNESEIPTFENIFGGDATAAISFAVFNKAVRQVRAAEEQFVLRESSVGNTPHIKQQPPPSALSTEEHIQMSRIFLGHLGFTALENRHKFVPLELSSDLLKDLERLDSMPERDCISISVIYLRSTDMTVNDLFQEVREGKQPSKEFKSFLRTISWPVSARTHTGFRARLDDTLCRGIPYYASQKLELVYNVPHYVIFPADEVLNSSTNLAARAAALSSSPRTDPASPMSTEILDAERGALSASFNNNTNQPRTIISMQKIRSLHPSTELGGSTKLAPPPALVEAAKKAKSAASQIVYSAPAAAPPSAGTTPPESPAAQFYFSQIAPDAVYIVWVEDGWQYSAWRRRIEACNALASVFLFVHPLPHMQGLYRVRLLKDEHIDDSALGPLCDGVIVSRHTLGMLVRLTAVNAHFQVRTTLKTAGPAYKKPYVARMQCIEEIINKHKQNLSISGYYSGMFTS